MASSAVPVRGAARAALPARADLAGRRRACATAARRSSCPAGAFIAGRSLFRIVAQSAQVVGNAAGGLLIALTSPRGALLLDCASFLGSALVVRAGDARARAARGRGRRGARSNILRDSLAGMSAVLVRPAHPARAAARLARAHLRRRARVAGGAVRRPSRPLRRRRSAGGSRRFPTGTIAGELVGHLVRAAGLAAAADRRARGGDVRPAARVRRRAGARRSRCRCSSSRASAARGCSVRTR